MYNQSSCMPKQNQSDPFHIGDKYGGIPLNLFTNMLGSAAIIILFLVIRKNAVKKVGRRIANDTLDNVENVTMILFGRRNNLVESMSEDSDRQTEAHKRRRFQTMESEDEGTDRNVITNKEGISEDAVQYLSFQKFIIIYVFFTTLISVGVVLPLNFQGSQLGNGTEFGHTTLANLHPGDPMDNIILWVHVIIAFLMFPSAILLMRTFSQGLKMTDTDLKTSRTVAIGIM